jgi:putative hydrolase of the HAD superfamily
VSIVAEFARELHESFPAGNAHPLVPVKFPAKNEELGDIRVVIFDVYGTLFNYWRDNFGSEQRKQKALRDSFAKTMDRFEMRTFIEEMNPDEPAEKTISDLYHGLITLKYELSAEKKVEFPEVRIEEIWEAIFLMAKRRGYDPAALNLGRGKDFIRCLAYCYNFFSYNRGFYPGVTSALQKLRDMNMRLGVLSNAQFYTLIDLSLFLRDQSNGEIDDYIRIFDQDLMFFSFEYGVSKPHKLLFRKLFDALYELEVLPSQTLFVGNDLASDIMPAQQAGMKAAFFTGDSRCAFMHDCAGVVVPDITFSAWEDLPNKISFHSQTAIQTTKGPE